jgi:hypothetical protein
MGFDKIIPGLEEIDSFKVNFEIFAAIHASPYNLASELRIDRFNLSTYEVFILPPESAPSKRNTSSGSLNMISSTISTTRPSHAVCIFWHISGWNKESKQEAASVLFRYMVAFLGNCRHMLVLCNINFANYDNAFGASLWHCIY